ncbi:MAG TPA: ubiquitin-like protein Pup [Actinopolymorphaceae bacterium]
MTGREGGQQQRSPRKSSDEEEVVDVQTDESALERKDQLDEDVDSILDEIDDVLETNSEEFVRSFVQKGGQ